MVVHVHQIDGVESASSDAEFEIGGLVECRTLREATELIGVTHRFRRAFQPNQHYLTTHLSQFHLSRACNIYPFYCGSLPVSRGAFQPVTNGRPKA